MKNMLKENKILEIKKSLFELRFIVISISAMLNKSNSCLCYVGLDNLGHVNGVKITNETFDMIRKEINNNIFPKVDIEITSEKLERKEVIKIKARGDKRPYSAYNKFYIRENDNDVLMDLESLTSIIVGNSINFNIKEEYVDFPLENINEKDVIDFATNAEWFLGNYIYKDVEDTLNHFGLIKNGLVAKSAILLFGNNNPVSLNLYLYEDDKKEKLKDVYNLKGNIIDLLNQSYEFIRSNLKFEYDENYQKIDEIPFNVINEVLVNCFAHADYESNLPIEICFTPSLISFYNPGNFIKGISPLDFALGIEATSPKNPLINLMLYLNKNINVIGQGFKNIFDICDNLKITYRFGNKDDGFNFEFDRPILKNKTISKPVIHETSKVATISRVKKDYDLSNIDKKVLDLIRNKPEYRKEDIARKIHKSLITVQRSIKKLMDANLIKRVGSNKTGHWVAIDK